MSASETIDLLTPGTVWLRRDGSQAKFLFLTNASLSPKMQLSHPPQVIYADMTGRIFNRGIDDFFRVYTFLNVDGELEKKIENLFVFNESDYTNVEDPADEDVVTEPEPIPAIVVPESNGEETLADSLLRELTDEKTKTASEVSESSALTALFGIGNVETLRNPVLTPADLAQALALYSQEPNKVYNLTQHRLLFKLSDTVTIANLVEAFHPSSEINTVDWFAIKTAISSDTIVWDSWIGVYPEFSAHALYASVLIGSSESPVDAEPTPGIDSEAVPSAPAPAPLPTTTSGYAQVIPNPLGDITQSVVTTVEPGITLNAAPVVAPVTPTIPVPEVQVVSAPGALMDPVAMPPVVVVAEALAPVIQPVVEPVVAAVQPVVQPVVVAQAVAPVVQPVVTAVS